MRLSWQNGRTLSEDREDRIRLGGVITDRYDVGETIEVRSLQAGRNHTLAVATNNARYALRIRGDAWWIGDESELNLRTRSP